MKGKVNSGENKTRSAYDDGDIPEIDLPSPSAATRDIPSEFDPNIPKLDESSRPRKDGPGGN